MTTMEKTKEQKELDSNQSEAQVSELQRNTFIPRTDVIDSEGKVEIMVEMPGVDKESVDISLKKNILTIEGKVFTPENREGYSLLLREFPVGNYHRTFTLGYEIEEGSIQARMKEGVLCLTLPKRTDAGPRKISVSAG